MTKLPPAGQKISEDGVYRISMEAYHGQPCVGPSVSSTDLRTLFQKSPAHMFVNSSLNPNKVQREETDAFILGRAAHHLFLGEDDFSSLFVMRPEQIGGAAWQGNRTVCKEWLAEQDRVGRTVVTPKQIEQIRGMARSLGAHPLVRAGILNGAIEQSVIHKDKKTGLWLKVRPDAIPNASGDFADLKTSSDSGFDLDRSISTYRYDMQAAMVGMASREVLGREMESFSFVFVEKEPPHSVDVLSLPKEDIERAERDLRVAIDVCAWCIEHNNWFGPSGTQLDARWVNVSEWVQKVSDGRRDFLRAEIAKADAVRTE